MIRSPQPSPSQGKVALVGAGPGDPELLTIRAARLIAAADAIVYDNLVGAEVLSLAQAGAQRIYVGKRAGNHAVPQHEINLMLVALAKQGLSVVRLKGGDPLIFGRGGEEAETLVDHGIDFEIVPGITTASGAAASAGIPLTHREYAQSCFFVAGHLKDKTCNLDWPTLARSGQTLVIYMGLTSIAEISAQLIAHGMPGDTPAACIRHATLPDQTTLISTIEKLPEDVRTAGVKPPALIIVGQVVALHAKLGRKDC